MSLSRWSLDQVPSQSGRTVIVTGANSGIGFEAARHLARRGARIVMACRNTEKGNEAAELVRSQVEGARVEVRELDLASLASVRDFAGAFDRDHDKLHVLCNNAGVMATPQRNTADGFELQFGTNHLGHFALTGLLLDKLLDSEASRVVTATSYVYHMGKIDFANLQGERSYNSWTAYAQSKLANLLFAFELDRKLRAHDKSTISLACHPGYAATNLQSAGPEMEGASLAGKFLRFTNKTVAQDASMGALPMVYAATGDDVRGGGFFGPDGLLEMVGYPVAAKVSKSARDEALAAELWRRSEELTGVHYAALA